MEGMGPSARWSVQTFFTNLEVQIIKLIWAFEVFFFATLAKNSSFFVNKTFAGKKQPDEEIGIEIIDGNMLRNFS